MSSEITMPQLSDTMTEGTVVKWRKKEGEKVKAGEEVGDIETDKATMPMEAFEGGTLAYIAVAEGQKAKVGDLLAVVATGNDDPAQVKAQYAAGRRPVAAAAAGSPGQGAHPPDVQPGDLNTQQARKVGSREAVAVGTQAEPAALRSGNGDGDRVRVSPLARRIALDRGVDLSNIRGTGPGGRIVERDVTAFIASGAAAGPTSVSAPVQAKSAAAPLPPVVSSGQKQTIQLTKMRQAIATALQRSKQQLPHFYETIDIDMEEVARLRERLNQKLEKENIKLSIADFIYKAVAAALLKHPALNARFNAEKGEVTRYGDVNLGFAVSLPEGLIVPVLRGINQMGLKEIRSRTVDLFERARAQRLRKEEQTEGTFTISSLGTYGVREFSAIINPPEVGILAVGAAEKRPVVRGDQIVARLMMTVTVSCDHRVVDGAAAAEFLATLKSLLEEPGMMIV